MTSDKWRVTNPIMVLVISRLSLVISHSSLLFDFIGVFVIVEHRKGFSIVFELF